MAFRRWRSWWREFDEITEVGPIARRYFVIGAFDGALTVLGIVIGASAALPGGPADSAFVVAISVSAAIALAVSSAVGAYEAERVEKKLHRHSIERAMLVEMSQEHRQAFRFAALYSAFVHGIAPMLAALIPTIPFLLLDFRSAVVAASIVTFAFLFFLGIYLGSLAREQILVTGLRFVVTGLGTAGILWLLYGAGLRFTP